jgi:hypothetical protein
VVRVPPTFNFADNEDISIEELLVLLDRMYIDLAEGVNSKPDLYQRDTDGQTTDVFLSQGSININTTTRKVEMLTEHTTATAVVWTQLS